MTTTIYLLRHASTTPSPSYAPEFDWPLDSRGRRQARELESYLSELAIDAVLSASQRRMIETVRPFCDSTELRPELLGGLRESACNRVWAEDFTGLIRRHWSDFDYHQKGCEPHRACQERFVGTLLQLAVDRAGGVLLCCSGGQAIALALHSTDPTFGYDVWVGIRRPDLFRLSSDGGRLEWDRSFTFPGLDGASAH